MRENLTNVILRYQWNIGIKIINRLRFPKGGNLIKKIKYVNYNMVFFAFLFILLFINITKFQQNNTYMKDLAHIRDIEKVEIYDFKSIKKFNDNQFLMEVEDVNMLNIFEKIFASSQKYNGLNDKGYLNNIKNVYPLKIFTKDNHYLIFLFLGNNKNNYITFYGNERLYDIKNYELVIELKEMLENF